MSLKVNIDKILLHVFIIYHGTQCIRKVCVMKAPSFTREELYEINDAVVPALRRLLESDDPDGHEKRYRTASVLLEVISKLYRHIGNGFGDQETAHPPWLHELAVQVRQLRQRAAQGISHGDSYPWDYWMERAVKAGVDVDLATLGRSVMREQYQHSWGVHADEVSILAGDDMIRLALDEPYTAQARWSWLLRTDGGRNAELGL